MDIVTTLEPLLRDALLFFGGAYVYWRGTQRGSPVPIIERMMNPPAKVEKPTPPEPPPYPCPKCNAKQSWSAGPGFWLCKKCNQTIPRT